MSIKSILISQPEPTNGNSPYSRLNRKYKIKVDYRPFIHVEGLTAKEVRTQKIDFSRFSMPYFIHPQEGTMIKNLTSNKSK